MNAAALDHQSRWQRAAAAMARDGIDALFLMKPANLAYFTGDGRPCALALLTRGQRCIVAVPECDVASVRRASVATEIRAFRSEEEMFHGFRDVLREQGLTEATIAIEKNFFDAALYEVCTAHILPKAKVVPATPLISALRMIKDAAEISCLEEAARIADIGMAAVARAVRAGVREVDVAGEASRARRPG